MREPVTHVLKCWPKYFEAVQAGRKRFELRRFDRDYRVGDTLDLREWDPSSLQFTGRTVSVGVTYLSECKPWLPEGFVVMSIEWLGGEQCLGQ